MTAIYKLKTDISVYKEIPLDAEDIAEQLDADDRIMDFVYMGVKDKALMDNWGPVSTQFQPSPVYPSAVKIPSIAVWVGSCLVFSEKAYAIFRLMLAEYGEFLPIDVKGFSYYLFNNLSDVEPDLAKSRYVDDDSQTVAALEFGPKAEQQLLFKSNWQGATACFCNQQFKQLCEDYEIEGLAFEENLLDVGYL